MGAVKVINWNPVKQMGVGERTCAVNNADTNPPYMNRCTATSFPYALLRPSQFFQTDSKHARWTDGGGEEEQNGLVTQIAAQLGGEHRTHVKVREICGLTWNVATTAFSCALIFDLRSVQKTVTCTPAAHKKEHASRRRRRRRTIRPVFQCACAPAALSRVRNERRKIND